MIKRYLSHMETKSTHERRQHAARVATVVTAVIFLGWLMTLGTRLATSSSATADSAAAQSQLANVINATPVDGGATLIVATSTAGY